MKTTDLIPLILYQLVDGDKYGYEIVKQIEDCSNGTKLEITNANKIQYLQKFNLDIARKMLDDFDNFIALMKNFVR